MQLGIAIGRTSWLDATWTTVHLARAALLRGHEVRFFEAGELEVDTDRALVGRGFLFRPPGPSIDVMVRTLHDTEAPRRRVPLSGLDVLLLRNAPLDTALLALAQVAQRAGVVVVNDPASLLQLSHKGWLAGLAGVPMPTTLVTQRGERAHEFLERERGDVVVKPAQGSGGRDVALVPAGDHAALDHAFLRAAARSRGVVVQRYLPEASEGEKRVVWMDGEILGGYVRQRAPGEFRHNLKQGGTPLPLDLTDADRAACDALAPHLAAVGVRLVGIDLIGGRVIEVNAINPGGAYHADRLHATDIAGSIISRLEVNASADLRGRSP